jgi:GNAT superfamily N-acetyltransferase
MSNAEPTSGSDVRIRPMRPDDVAAVERLTSQSYYELDQRTSPRGASDPSPRSAARGLLWQRRVHHLLGTDPGGCWVAEVDGAVVGTAVSFNRELMWVLASFAVRPDLQGAGIGAQLLAGALHHGRGCLRGILSASADPKAARRYKLAGFDLHPQMLLRGHVERSAIPVVDRVREGSAGDYDLMDSVDRRARGAAHGPDHAVLAAEFLLLVADRSTGSGYVYATETGSPVLLAATNRRTAADLTWSALAMSPPDVAVEIPHVTAANQWAIDLGIAARLDLHTLGYLAVRRMKPPAPYLHHGSFL